MSSAAHARRLRALAAGLAIVSSFLFEPRAAVAQPAPPTQTPDADDDDTPGQHEDHAPSGDEASSTRLFYFGQEYGSESQFTPANVLVNVGFGSLGHLGTTSLIGDIDYWDNASRLVDAYFHPVLAVRDSWPGDTAGFFALELVSPANSFLHFLGEGMLSRKLSEWYEAQGIDRGWAKALAITTVFVSQQINEIVEADVPNYPTSEPVADFVWNAAGLLAFSFDGFARLFADTSDDDQLQMYYWPGQPVIDVQDGALFGHGESYLIRTTLGGWTAWKLAVQAGIPNFGIGVSVPLGSSDALSVMPVARSQEVQPVGYEVPAICHDEDADTSGVDCPFLGAWSVKVNWDRDGSLMASVGLHTDLRGLNVSVYPGVIDFGRIDVGAYAIFDLDDASSVGLTMSYAPLVPGARW